MAGMLTIYNALPDSRENEGGCTMTRASKAIQGKHGRLRFDVVFLR